MSSSRTKISLEDARLSGINIDFEKMENGEKRYRLMSSDGSYYCRTVAAETGAWQNSHYHKRVTEFYVIQSGWIVYAEIGLNEDVDFRFLKDGESIFVKPFVHHNLFLSPHTIIHTIKYGGEGSEIDWFPSKELDHFIKNLSENDLKDLIKYN
ncbi:MULTISPECIES: hypothetical protein [Bacillaceae]|uniref:Cupin domain-containing protein n=1 Tax=Evansella alkalicola TaxID=745819 RepID=A0ABS6JRU7_9BACI|nr:MULTISPECIES: hypothetical protein [Bacillaceae]MBU9721288.1 hypothetical protein [Bacillus alkalicola]